MTTPPSCSNVGYLTDSSAPYQVLVEVDEGKAGDDAATANKQKSRSPLANFLTKAGLCAAVFFTFLYLLIVVFVNFLHPTVPNAEAYLNYHPPCEGPIRYIDEITSINFNQSYFKLHFNYVSEVLHGGYGFQRGDAVQTVEGTDVQRASSNGIFSIIDFNWPCSMLGVKSCKDALELIEDCESRYKNQYNREYYPYRYVDMVRRCEEEHFDKNVISNIFADFRRYVLFMIHKHKNLFPCFRGMMSPSPYANAGLSAGSDLPYDLLLDIDEGDETNGNETDTVTANSVRRRRTLWQWIKIIMLAATIIAVLLYLALLSYHHFFHPNVKPSEPFLASPPECDDEIRVVNVIGFSPFASALHFNYITQVNETSPAIGRLWRGDAIISVNGMDVQGNCSDVVWKLLLENFPTEVRLEVKSCPDALAKLEKCEAKYQSQYEKRHYPFRYVDLLRRCESEHFDVNVPSNIVDDIWRNVLYFIHRHQAWFPSERK